MTLTTSRKAVDNAGLRFRDLCEEVGDRAMIQHYRLFRSNDLVAGFSAITAALTDQPAQVSGRLKRTDTIIRKLRRARNMKLTYMDDVVGFRILVPSPQVQQTVTQLLTAVLPVKSTKDYVQAPVESGYQGIHLICHTQRTFPGKDTPSYLTYEIQVRTVFQHFWSTTSESMGEQVKEGGGTEEQRTELVALSRQVRLFEENNQDVLQGNIRANYSAPHFYVVNYDKHRGRILSLQAFSSDFPRALDYYRYLEDKASRDLSREVVLLAGVSEDELKNSHMRYYVPSGRPQIPLELAFRLDGERDIGINSR